MRTRLTLILVCSFVALNFSWTKERPLRIAVTNPTQLERSSETISVRLDELVKKLPSFNARQFVLIDEKTKAELLTQVAADELLFQSDFKPEETKSFLLRKGLPKTTPPTSLVDGRFVEPRQDYAWENDRIAFRMYGPALAKEVNNGIDVWTKRVRYLIVEKWYKGEEDTGAAKISYHTDHGEGADFFSVGKTLGAGSCGIWHNNKVYQPGVFSSYKTIMNGPIRLRFELTYDKLDVDGKTYKEIKRITLDAGQNLNRIDVTYSGSDEKEEIQFVAGLVKRKNTVLKSDEGHAWMSLWGLTSVDSINGSLGTGVVMSKSVFAGVTEEKDQYLMVGNTQCGATVSYYAGAGWTRAGDFVSQADWNKYLDEFALRLASPLHVKLSVQ